MENKKSKLDPAKQQSVDSILEHLPPEVEEIVDLPSKGRFYNTTEPVIVKPMTFDDEKALISSTKGKTDPMSLLLSRCVKNVNPHELLMMDKVFIFMKIRQLSYGTDYEVRITCPKCEEAGEVKIDLTTLPVNDIPDDFEDPREFELPVLKKKVKVRFPRGRDEKYLKNPEVAASQFWRFVEEIDGVTDKGVIAEVMKQLQSKNALADIHKIISEVTRADFGVEAKFIYLCSECDEETLMEVPIGEDFFTMK